MPVLGARNAKFVAMAIILAGRASRAPQTAHVRPSVGAPLRRSKCIRGELPRVKLTKLPFRVIESLSESLQACKSVLTKLYPDYQVSDLIQLSREELVTLLHDCDLIPTGNYFATPSFWAYPLTPHQRFDLSPSWNLVVADGEVVREPILCDGLRPS